MFGIFERHVIHGPYWTPQHLLKNLRVYFNIHEAMIPINLENSCDCGQMCGSIARLCRSPLREDSTIESRTDFLSKYKKSALHIS